MSAVRRRQLFITLAAMILAALAEVALVGAVLPFLSLLAGDVAGNAGGPLVRVLRNLGGTSLFGASLLLIGGAVAAALTRLLVNWLTQAFAAGFGHDLAVAVFGR